MSTDYAYEAREYQEHANRMREVERASLSDRKVAAAEFADAMAHRPEVVRERIEWLIDGSYGYGSMQQAKRVLKQSARANKAAALTQMVGALEWSSPARMTIAAWKKLTAAEKAALAREVGKAIEYGQRSRA